jgi:hypothetical protein
LPIAIVLRGKSPTTTWGLNTEVKAKSIYLNFWHGITEYCENAWQHPLIVFIDFRL